MDAKLYGRICTRSEARALSGGLNSVYYLLRDGRLASVPTGRRRFTSATAIEAFIVATTATEPPEGLFPAGGLSRCGWDSRPSSDSSHDHLLDS